MDLAEVTTAESVASALEQPLEGEWDLVSDLEKGADQEMATAILRLLTKADPEVVEATRQLLAPESRAAGAGSSRALLKAVIAAAAGVESRIAEIWRAHLAGHGTMLSKSAATVAAIKELPPGERDATVDAIRLTTPRPVAKAEPRPAPSRVMDLVRALAKGEGVSESDILRRRPDLYAAFTREAHGGAIFDR